MPTYKVTDPDTGRVLRLTGDSPPTEEEAAQAFKDTPPVKKSGGGFGALRQAEDRIAAESAASKNNGPGFTGNTPLESNSASPEGIFSSGDTPTPEASRAALAAGASVAAPELAALIPGLGFLASGAAATPVARGLMSTIGRTAGPAAASGAISGAAGGAVESGGDLNETVKQAVAGAAMAPVITGAARIAGSVARSGGRLSGAVADLFRPSELSPTQLQGLRSRATVKTASGVDVPVGLAETINSGELTRRMGLENAEPTPEEMTKLSELVLHRAANVDRSNRTPQEISRQVFDILDPQRQGIDAGVKRAVERFSNQAANAVSGAESSVRAIGRRFFPPGRSQQDTGNELGDLAHGSLQSTRRDWNAAFENVRTDPDYGRALVDVSPIQRLANAHGLDFVSDPAGNISVIGAPAGARQAIESGGQVSGPVSLEQARNMVSELSKNVRNAGFMPGVDTRIKAQMAELGTQQIQNALTPYPRLQQALGAANKMYAENIGRFKNGFAEGIIKDVGQQGGFTPEAIMRKLTGPDAGTNLSELEKLLGKGQTAGSDTSQRGMELVRESILSTAANTGRMGGDFNVGKMVGTIEGLPPDVRGRLFPNYGVMRDAMMKEAAIGQVAGKTRTPEAFLSAVDADPALVRQALGATDAAQTEQLARQAVAKGVAAKNQLAALGLDELKDKNAFDLAKFALDPVNMTKTRNLVTRLQASDPSLLADTRATFLDDLFQRSTHGGQFSPEKFQELVGDAIPGAGGRAAGHFNEQLSNLFGPGSKTQISDVVKALGQIPSPVNVTADSRRGLMSYLLGGYAGGSVANGSSPNTVMNFANRIWNSYPEIRYRYAAAFLTDPTLREQAMRPVGTQSARDMRRVANMVSRGIMETYGPKSDMYKEAKNLEESNHQ